jgi:N6-L-threonylcarbamoyladenine synthase
MHHVLLKLFSSCQLPFWQAAMRIPQLRPKFGFLGYLQHARSFAVLALESSADDTGASVVTSSREILSNVIVKQHEL